VFTVHSQTQIYDESFMAMHRSDIVLAGDFQRRRTTEQKVALYQRSGAGG
jgi:hypothetical protein